MPGGLLWWVHKVIAVVFLELPKHPKADLLGMVHLDHLLRIATPLGSHR